MFPTVSFLCKSIFRKLNTSIVDVYWKHFPNNSYSNLVLFVLWENKLTNNENCNIELFIDLAKATWEKRQTKANDNGKRMVPNSDSFCIFKAVFLELKYFSICFSEIESS